MTAPARLLTFVIPDLIRDPFLRRCENGPRIKSGVTMPGTSASARKRLTRRSEHKMHRWPQPVVCRRSAGAIPTGRAILFHTKAQSHEDVVLAAKRLLPSTLRHDAPMTKRRPRGRGPASLCLCVKYISPTAKKRDPDQVRGDAERMSASARNRSFADAKRNYPALCWRKMSASIWNSSARGLPLRQTSAMVRQSWSESSGRVSMSV